MTAVEMDTLLLIEYDRVSNSDAPGYTVQERSELLSAAQEELVHHIYNPLANEYHEGAEETEFSLADLQELVNDAVLTVSADQTGVLTHGKFFDLPVDHYLTLMENATITSNTVAEGGSGCYTGTELRVKPITHDEYTINRNNPYKQPKEDELIWRLAKAGRKFELVTDGLFTVDSYNMRYIKKPNPIIVDASVTVDGVTGIQNCELNDITHRRIVAYAVRKASAITDPQMYQLKQQEQKSGN